MDLVNVSVQLKKAHFPFDRANGLANAMDRFVTDYYRKALIGGRFEARGVIVVGDSRQGKSTEIDKYLSEFNDGTTLLPDGRPAKIVSCLLSGKVTWKSLGVEILEVLGYPLKGQHRQTDIWPQVRKIAKLQGVVGIHFDKCQHVFSETDGVTYKKMLDSFKSLLKDPHWPLMLIFSGVPTLAKHINKEEQLAFLLQTVSFDGIDLTRKADMDELIQLVFSYGDKAQLEFDDFGMEDFLERLAFSARGC
jgi:hypothetical protein